MASISNSAAILAPVPQINFPSATAALPPSWWTYSATHNGLDMCQRLANGIHTQLHDLMNPAPVQGAPAGWQRLLEDRGLWLGWLAISLPIPFTHFLAGWANVIICLGLMNRDGKAVALGMVLAIGGAGVAGAGLWLGGKAIEALFG